MSPTKLCGLLGMCRRSGRLTVGFDAVMALDGTPGAVLFMATDASSRTEKNVRRGARRSPLYRLPLSKDEIARAIGSQKPVAVLATTDVGFAEAFCNLATPILKEESHHDD